MIISHPKTCLHIYNVLSIRFNSIIVSKKFAQSLSCCSMSRSKDKRKSKPRPATNNQQHGESQASECSKRQPRAGRNDLGRESEPRTSQSESSGCRPEIKTLLPS